MWLKSFVLIMVFGRVVVLIVINGLFWWGLKLCSVWVIIFLLVLVLFVISMVVLVFVKCSICWWRLCIVGFVLINWFFKVIVLVS